MPLTFESGQYQIDGEVATDAEVLALRDVQIETWAAELALLTRDALGIDEPSQAIEFPLPRINTWAGKFLARAGQIVSDAYVYAAGGVEKVTSAGWTTVAALVAKQTDYGRGFLADLKAGKLSGEQAVARAELYAGAAVNAFEQGKASLRGIDLPAYPGDGCLGGANCRCAWDISADGTEATWVAAGDKNTCSVCRDRASEWAPYRPSA